MKAYANVGDELSVFALDKNNIADLPQWECAHGHVACAHRRLHAVEPKKEIIKTYSKLRASVSAKNEDMGKAYQSSELFCSSRDLYVHS